MSKRKKSLDRSPSTSAKKKCVENVNNASEKDIENDETEVLSASITSKKKGGSKYKGVFRYEVNNKNQKIGVCILCEVKGLTGNKRIEILRTNASTNGLKNHLKANHVEVFNDKFPSEAQKLQRNLDQYVNVSKFYNPFFIFYPIKLIPT